MDVRTSISKNFVQPDAWAQLKKFTNARIAIGRTGTAIPLAENLHFKASHALARDAVYTQLDTNKLVTQLCELDLTVLILQSKAANRQQYLQRPDFGRQLNESSITVISNITAGDGFDIAITIADGLSADAVQRHSIPVVKGLLQLCNSQRISIAPVCLALQGRVAISDQVGALLNTKLSVIFIGERPGLSSPYSMGIYITFNPCIGNTDESRNCISNVHPQGLSYSDAANQLFSLIQKAFELKLTGVHLKTRQLQ